MRIEVSQHSLRARQFFGGTRDLEDEPHRRLLGEINEEVRLNEEWRVLGIESLAIHRDPGDGAAGKTTRKMTQGMRHLGIMSHPSASG
jgi:hypothetical protein